MFYCCCIIFYRLAWKAQPLFQSDPAFTPRTKISVIIPARDEENNIGPCIRSMLAQQYPPYLYEVIIIDDHSTDQTAAVIQSIKDQRIRLLSLHQYIDPKQRLNAYKKKAIELAIAQSNGDLIVTTDADCIVQPNWLNRIAQCYEYREPVFIAAPVAYTGENSFLKRFQSLDFLTLQGITGASVYKKTHTMCNGANLAYSKAVFYEVGAFQNIDNIASGDDMLLMHKMYKRYPDRIEFLKSPDAIVFTAPMENWKAFINQRIRWASKADKYDDKRIFGVLILVYLFNAWFLVLLIASLFNIQYLHTFLEIMVVKTIIEMWYLFPVARFFDKQNLIWYFPISQPVHILYTIVAGWLGKFGTYQWKGRVVK